MTNTDESPSWIACDGVETAALETYDVVPESWADVYQPSDDVVVFDAGVGGEWLESDTVIEVRE